MQIMIIIGIFLGLILIAFSLRFTWWWTPLYNGLIVFMYHHIKPACENAEGEDLAFTITPEIFEKQVKYLLSKKYTFIGLEDLTSGKKIKNPVMITFDDGYIDNYNYVFPILKKYGIKAVIFLIATEIGNPGFFTWQQALEMQKSGLVSFGSHGLTHKNIRRMAPSLAAKELKESKIILEEKLEHTVTAFCYPFGAGGTDKRVRKLVAEAGYLFDFSTRRGLNPWPLKAGRTIYRAFPRGGESKLDFILQTHLGRSKL